MPRKLFLARAIACYYGIAGKFFDGVAGGIANGKQYGVWVQGIQLKKTFGGAWTKKQNAVVVLFYFFGCCYRFVNNYFFDRNVRGFQFVWQLCTALITAEEYHFFHACINDYIGKRSRAGCSANNLAVGKIPAHRGLRGIANAKYFPVRVVVNGFYCVHAGEYSSNFL